MDKNYYDRFSTSKSTRDSARGSSRDRPSTATKGTHENFHGRFSTTTMTPEGFGVLGGQWGFWQLLIMLVVAFDLVFGFVRPFVMEPMRVPSESMAPTLQPGDRVLTNKLAYDLASPERGDLVVFDSLDQSQDEKVVKRVIGLPGDEISIEKGVLMVNRQPPDEPYLAPTANPTPQTFPGLQTFGPLFVPKDHVFVMGDNRANSYDSRFFGPVPQANLVGEVSLRFWPLDRRGDL